MMVDLPEPGGADQRGDGARARFEADAVQDWLAGLVGEADVVEIDSALDAAGIDVRSGSCFFGLSRRISRVRSRPARASVICVPMLTTWNTGAIMKAGTA